MNVMQKNKAYHLSANDIIPIELQTIRIGIIPGFNLFLQNMLDNKPCYVLYNKGDHVIEKSHIEELQNNKVENLYILKSEQGKYFKYVEVALQRIVNENIDVKEKSYLVYNVAKNIMLDVFDDPRSGANIGRTRIWVAGTVDFIMTSKGASANMLNMVSYDYYTYTHCVNVTVLGLLFAKHLGLDVGSMHLMGTGLLLHDIGKTQIDSSIIKRNGRLSKEEFMEVKKHVDKGVAIIKQLGGIDEGAFYPIVQHHEREDGGGYPCGLGRNEIHPFGKIAKIVDVYDALTTRRSYSEARKPFSALTTMNGEMKGHFNLQYLKQFIRFLGSGEVFR